MPDFKWNKRWGWEIIKHRLFRKKEMYGLHWGVPNIQWAEDNVKSHINSDTIVLELGPGGGRWTQYLLDAKKIILVDLNPEFFPYLKKQFKDHKHKFEFYRTSGCELAGIPTDSIDFFISMGSFVHIEPEDIDRYLVHIRRVLKPNCIGIIQYANKDSKEGRENKGYSDMNTRKMAAVLEKNGLLKTNENGWSNSLTVFFRNSQ